MSKINKKMGALQISTDPAKKDARKMRKRLSIAQAKNQSPLLLDGVKNKKQQSSADNFIDADYYQNIKSKLFKSYATKTKVGVVPFNPNKVNQDRAIVVPTLPNTGSSKASLFGVFDGHGMHGHDVSSFLLQQMPRWFTDNKNWIKDPKKSLFDNFQFLTKALKKSLSV